MKLVATTVSKEGYGEEAWNKRRLSAAEQALEKAANLGADVLALPGGFFTVRTPQARGAIAASLLSKAKQVSIAVVFGVDQKGRPSWDSLLKAGRPLPSYGYAWSPSENVRHCWVQRSFTSKNQCCVSDVCCKDVRLLKICNETLAVLMCGEIFNERIRDVLAMQRPKPKVVADVAHDGYHFRIEQAMKVLGRKGLASMCSVHAQREYAKKRCYLPQKGLVSTNDRDDCVSGPPRIELKLWKFPRNQDKT